MSTKIEILAQLLHKSKQEIAKVIIGQEEVVNMALIAVFTGNHALVEGVPGVAKTLLVRTLAYILGSDFARIQFTPDLMPADITGTNVFNLKENEFSLVKGPIFTTFLLADEINRAPAKTQSALLQAMQEKEVSIDRKTYRLSEHFTVFATQNPIEYQGTYPLPEAQKDRFMLKINMYPPSREEELRLAEQTFWGSTPEEILNSGQVKQIVAGEDLLKIKKSLQKIIIKEELLGYILDIVRKTREHPQISVGAGPRATQAMIQASRVLAGINARDFVTPDDIKYLALPVLGHRLMLRPEYEVEGLEVEEVVQNVLQEVTVPR